jgi:glycosyltransferase involved in cell wall biosynthesis
MHSFPDITLLITHYNRSSSLERLLKRFKEIECQFGDIVVADDCSKNEHRLVLEELKQRYGIKIAESLVNKGLGHNLNKGHDAVTTPYTLYVQEDFIPHDIFPSKLKKAYSIMESRSDLDMARFYAYFKYPYLKPLTDGFSEMKFSASPFSPGYRKFYFYSDHPHLKRHTFFKRFGRYAEGVRGDVTEYKMMMSVLKNKGRALYYEDFKGLFDQVNTEDEPSTMKREYYRTTPNLAISLIRDVYRYIKFNRDYFR